MDLGPYTGFILGSYAISALVVVALIAWVQIDRRLLERTLDELAAKGHGRGARSGASTAARPASGQVPSNTTSGADA